ncbi:MAG: carboxypeptidase-like regulatory domain-containing protein [Terracidiphilus sp.]
MRIIAASMLCSLALLLPAGPAWAQNAAPAPARPAYHSPTSAPGFRIAGTVVNAATGEPVWRATVSLLSYADQHAIESVETGSDGRFAFEGLPAAKYPLTASKRGFRNASYDEHGGYSTAIVTGADQDTSGLVFRLVPGAALHGVVTGDGGDPVEGAEVMLFLKPRGHNPGDRIAQVGIATTDDTGAYEFDNLAAGEYLVAVKAEPWYALHRSDAETQRPANDPSAALDVAYPVTFFDSTTDEASASPIVLAGGSREEANLNLRAVPSLRLSVQAPTASNEGMAGLTLEQTIFGSQIPSGRGPVSTSPQSKMAEFTGVAPGHYELTQGNPPRVTELDATASQQVDPSLGTPSVAISGTTRIASGAPLTGKLTLILSPLDTAHPTEPKFATSNQGSFRFPSVQPGKWELLAWGGDPAGPGRQITVVSTASAGKANAGNLITVRDKPVSLTVTLSDSDTRVEGFARKEGKGRAGALIALVPKDPAAFRARLRIDQSDSDGSFSLRDVAPGEYTVMAIEDGWDLDRTRPEAFARYLSQGIAVTVTESSGKLVRLSESVPVAGR